MNIATVKESTVTKHRCESASSSSTTLLSEATVAPPEIRVRCPTEEDLKRRKEVSSRSNLKKD